MKKIVFSSFAASMLFVSTAIAVDGASLTTKNYVDTGLRAVYNVTKETTDVLGQRTIALDERTTALEGILNGENGGTGLVATVAEMQDNMQNAQGVVYAPGSGVEIQEHTIAVSGLSDTTDPDNQEKMYIYKNGSLEAMPIRAMWGTDEPGD